MKQKLILLLIGMGLLLALIVVACGPAQPRQEATPTAPPATDTPPVFVPDSSDPFDSLPDPAEVDEADYTTTASGLQYYDLEAGAGPSPNEGDIVTVHYTIWLHDEAQLLDSSTDMGRPLTFVLGSGQVFEGWNEGVLTMNEGGRRQLVIPPALAFGEQGIGGVIPPNAVLVLEVELLAVQGAPEPVAVADADYTVTESGLRYYDLVEGEGVSPNAGDAVTVNYNIWLADGEKYIGGSDTQGGSIDFQVGSGQVFPGWDEGVATMQAGGTRQLLIAPELGLGEFGLDELIPPNATLIMEVELLEVRQAAVRTEIDEADYTTTESGLKYYDLEAGDGASPQPGQLVVVHYTGWLEDGTQFDSSLDRGQPFVFTLGMQQVIPGWDEGVATMQVGGRRQLLIPPDLGYGEAGAGGVIPPNATLIFEVELLEVR